MAFDKLSLKTIIDKITLLCLIIEGSLPVLCPFNVEAVSYCCCTYDDRSLDTWMWSNHVMQALDYLRTLM